EPCHLSCRPLRGLAVDSLWERYELTPTQGSRTRPGLYAVAHCAGLPAIRFGKDTNSRQPRARGLALGSMLSPTARRCCRFALGIIPAPAHPALADSPWALSCRPLRGLAGDSLWERYELTPTQGSRTRPGLYAVAHCAGLPAIRFGKDTNSRQPRAR